MDHTITLRLPGLLQHLSPRYRTAKPTLRCPPVAAVTALLIRRRLTSPFDHLSRLHCRYNNSGRLQRLSFSPTLVNRRQVLSQTHSTPGSRPLTRARTSSHTKHNKTFTSIEASFYTLYTCRFSPSSGDRVQQPLHHRVNCAFFFPVLLTRFASLDCSLHWDSHHIQAARVAGTCT